MVMLGYQQKERDSHWDSSASPTPRMESVRAVAIEANQNGRTLGMLDVQAAFLQSHDLKWENGERHMFTALPEAGGS